MQSGSFYMREEKKNISVFGMEQADVDMDYSENSISS